MGERLEKEAATARKENRQLRMQLDVVLCDRDAPVAVGMDKQKELLFSPGRATANTRWETSNLWSTFESGVADAAELSKRAIVGRPSSENMSASGVPASLRVLPS